MAKLAIGFLFGYFYDSQPLLYIRFTWVALKTLDGVFTPDVEPGCNIFSDFPGGIWSAAHYLLHGWRGQTEAKQSLGVVFLPSNECRGCPLPLGRDPQK